MSPVPPTLSSLTSQAQQEIIHGETAQRGCSGQSINLEERHFYAIISTSHRLVNGKYRSSFVRAMVNNIFRSLSVTFRSPFLGLYFHQGLSKKVLFLIRKITIRKCLLNHYRPAMPFGNRKKNTLKDHCCSVL